MKLTIISHTKHFRNKEGTIVGWGPTITELNQLANDFDQITHVAMFYKGESPQSSMPYTSNKIKFVALPVLGGKTILSKLKSILLAPRVINIVSKEINKSDVFQLRAPTGIGVFLIPFLTIFVKKKGWYKYAGNWMQNNPPFGYRLQRWMLKKQRRKVTVNGEWKNQSNNILAFENPCLTQEDRGVGEAYCNHKNINENINYCFVGGLNNNKGIDKIIDAFKEINSDKIGTLHIVGCGVLKSELEQVASRLSINIVFYGSLPKERVQEIYKNSHFIILPSLSEGFPKVIGEAMNYGCVPIVSDISCIGQYVKNGNNGFLIDPITIEEIKKEIRKSLTITNKEFKDYISKNYNLAYKFTYDYYLERIKNIFKYN